MSIPVETEFTPPAVVPDLIEPNESLLLRLREAAKTDRDEPIRLLLRRAADNLQDAVGRVAKLPTKDSMTNLNGCWSQAIRALGQAKGPPENTTHGAGLGEGALLAEAA